MPPRPLRAVTKKGAAALPQHAKFGFLSDASRIVADQSLELAMHLGRRALQVKRGDASSRGRPMTWRGQAFANCKVSLRPL